jgi:hypothetical protein
MDRYNQSDAETRKAPRHSGSKRTPQPTPDPAAPRPESPRELDRDPEEEGSAGKRQV